MSAKSLPLPPTSTVGPLRDPVVERHGSPVRSLYAQASGARPISETVECVPDAVTQGATTTPASALIAEDSVAAGDAGLPATLVVRPWSDSVVEKHGFPVSSPYVEAVLLPILGPSATLCLRRLGAWVAAAPDGIAIDLQELAGDLVLGRGLGRSAPLGRTIKRLCSFAMARWQGHDLVVRTAVAPVTERQLQRLSPALAAFHRQMVRGAQIANGPAR